jgi:hypothetical protein
MVDLNKKSQTLLLGARAVLVSMALLSPATAQQAPQIATTAKVRQVIIQNQSGGIIIGRSTIRSMRVVQGRTQLVTDDPAAAGKLETEWKQPLPAEMPAGEEANKDGEEKEDTGAFAALSEVHFAPVVDEQLAAGAHREITMDVVAPSILLGSAQWIGPSSPLTVTLSMNGATLASGGAASHGNDNRGKAVLRAVTSTTGPATLSVTNTSEITARVRLILGDLPQ